MKRWLIALLVLLLSKRKRGERQRALPPAERLLPEKQPDRRAENGVLALLGLAALSALVVIVDYAFGADTQVLGIGFAGAFAFLGLAAVVASRRLVPQGEAVEPLPEHEHPLDEAETEQLVREGFDGVTRRKLLVVAAGGAVGALGVALVTPALSLGPVLDTETLAHTPWRRGIRLVDEEGEPIALDQLAVGGFLTAFPEHGPLRRADSPLVVVRVKPSQLDLPADRAGWAPHGVLAFSKICTHAACAVSLFRYPLFEPTSARPALVCPCHYSTFDVGRGGEVVFGPAGRPLPQLPLAVATDGTLVAAGGLSGRPGPSWWGVRG
jgi:ubiquinol-cytochrome c reductase iron-sulfur subunit